VQCLSLDYLNFLNPPSNRQQKHAGNFFIHQAFNIYSVCFIFHILLYFQFIGWYPGASRTFPFNSNSQDCSRDFQSFTEPEQNEYIC